MLTYRARVSPQRKGTPTPEQYRLIYEAREARDAAEAHLVKVVVDAMKAGASHREVAPAAGISDRTALRWGHANGWPTAAQKRAAADAKAARDEIDDLTGMRRIRELLDERDEVNPPG